MIVEFKIGGLDIFIDILRSSRVNFGVLFSFADIIFAVFGTFPVFLNGGLDIITDGLEDVKAIIKGGGERSFMNINKLPKNIDRIFEYNFQLSLFISNDLLILWRQLIGFADDISKRGNNGSRRLNQKCIVVMIVGYFINTLFIHC